MTPNLDHLIALHKLLEAARDEWNTHRRSSLDAECAASFVVCNRLVEATVLVDQAVAAVTLAGGAVR